MAFLLISVIFFHQPFFPTRHALYLREIFFSTMKFNIAVIGTGNLAWHLAPALESAGHIVTEVYGRNIDKAARITSKLYAAEITDDLDFSESQAEIYILAVSDQAIPKVADSIILPEGSLLVHTSGSTPMDILAYSSASYIGTFYPLQSFTISREVNFRTVPILYESDDKHALGILKTLTQSISSSSYYIKSRDRQALHIAAVFASNFTNHMLRLSEEILERQGLDFEMLKPLVLEQIDKSLEMGPEASQTGPAIRGDFSTLDQHYHFLNYREQIAEIYKLVSQDIIDLS